MNQLLIELLTEELPPKALKKLSDAFSNTIYQELQKYALLDNQASLQSFATPRRLAVLIDNVLIKTEDKQQQTKLMPYNIAIKDNKRTLPFIKKLNSIGLNENSPFDIVHDGKQDYISVNYIAKGVNLADKINEILHTAINKLPVPKLMSYQLEDGNTVNFVRPAHNLLCLLNNEVIDCSILGLKSNNRTYGHRFLGGMITIDNPNSYEQTLLDNKVVACYNKRMQMIKNQLQEQALDQELGCKLQAPQSLLEEVNSLVEYPQVYAGNFDEKFLDIPKECLILSMQTHQKYFPLMQNDKLLPKFLFVSNMPIDDPINIIKGNEKVIRPRLSDAQFFFSEDKKTTLKNYAMNLSNIVYHNKLGNQQQRISRIEQIALYICKNEPKFNSLENFAYIAASVCKSDLLTNMVSEFPELQGIMGKYYAQFEGYNSSVALAIEEHYKPKFAGDSLPSENLGLVLALADKLETLVGIWGIGLKPSGEKDPYALRRNALGIIRILFEKNLSINLYQTIQYVSSIFENSFEFTTDNDGIFNFCLDRLENYLKDNYAPNIIQASLYNDYIDNKDSNFSTLKQNLSIAKNLVEDTQNLYNINILIAANKRINNIIKNEYAKNNIIDINLFDSIQEKNLYTVYNTFTSQNIEIYKASSQLLQDFADSLNDFFDNVMVNASDIHLKNNRINLLTQIAKLCNKQVFLSKL